MRTIFLGLLIIAVTGQSCKNTYEATQTPDDVYYSPVRGMEETKRKETRNQYSYTEDRQFVMSRHDRRWRDFNDDYNYRYDPYHYGYNYGYYYNPFYYPYPVYTYTWPQWVFVNPKNTTPRTTNLSSYQFQNVRTVDPKNSGPVIFQQPGRSYNNSNYDYSSPRENITPRSGGYGNDNNTRSYNPSSGSSGSSSSGTPVTRPGRN